MTLFFSVHQHSQEANCYAVAATCYLIGNHPDKFLQHLYSLMQQGSFKIRGQEVPFFLFFPYLNSHQAWYDHPYSLGIDHLCRTTAVKETLLACGISETTSEALPSSYTPLEALLCLTSKLNNSYLETILRLYLQSFQESLLVRLFIYQQEFLNINFIGAEYGQTSLKTVHDLLQQELLTFLDFLPKKIALNVTNSIASRFFFFNLPPSSLPASLTECEHTGSHQKALNRCMRLCYIYGSSLHIFHSFRELRTNMMNLVPEIIQKRLSQRSSDLGALSLLPAQMLIHLKFQELAKFSTHSFSSQQPSLKFPTPSHFLRCDDLLFCKHGSHEAYVLSEVVPDSFNLVIASEATRTSEILEELNACLHHYYRHQLPSCLLLQLAQHAFYLYLQPHSWISLPTEICKQHLEHIIIQGTQQLETAISQQQILNIVFFCYPFEEDCQTIIQRLKLSSIATHGDFIEHLLKKIDQEDRERVQVKIQQYYSSCLVRDLQDFCQALSIQVSAPLLKAELESRIVSEHTHSYQVAYRLRKILAKKGRYFSQQRIMDALIQHAGAKPCIMLGDLNYAYVLKDNSKHKHAIAEFDFVHREIRIFTVHKHHYDATPWEHPKGGSFVIPKAKIV
ncbi:MAG: hypothetical protein JSS62_07185 [Verrucomicrobia bacterium]|nr:hypothetical protein [Verrucomicrobiota bacterium]MBS0647413.1 hypothetical protein [Verrucomicrobiota bacterium]